MKIGTSLKKESNEKILKDKYTLKHEVNKEIMELKHKYKMDISGKK